MKKLFSLLSLSFAFLISANAQSFLEIHNPVLGNPAIANYNDGQTLLNTTELFHFKGQFSFTNNISYFSKIRDVNVSVSNLLHSYEHFKGYSQYVAFSKGFQLKKGELLVGAGAYLGKTNLDFEALNITSDTIAYSRLGYGLNIGVNYLIGNHQIGIGLNNALGRTSVVNVQYPTPHIYTLNFRYQTTFFTKWGLEIQPVLSHQMHLHKDIYGSGNRFSYPDNYSILGSSFKYKGFKVGYNLQISQFDIVPSFIDQYALIGYDFKKLSLNYGQFFYRSSIGEFRTVDHYITLRYSFNGIEKGTQLF
jgi:hypothetical protein